MNDDEFGRDLASRLHRRDPGTPDGLLSGSLQRARVLRRRRTAMGAIAAVVAAAVVGGGAIGFTVLRPNEPAVVGTPSIETTAASARTPTRTPSPSPAETSAALPKPPASSSTRETTKPSGPASTPPSGPALCRYGTTEVSVKAVQGAAGTIEYAITATNAGKSACVIQGFPGVSIVAGDEGTQVGAPAVRMEMAPSRIELKPGEHATATLFVTQAGNYGEDCKLVAGRGFRIYLPDEKRADFAKLPVDGCANDKIELLRIQPFSV